MRDKIVRFGVVGTNSITELFIAGASKIKNFKLSAVYSRTEDKAREFANKYGVDKIFTDLEEMAMSSDIDAVYIASPNAFHGPQSIIFLNNKKHVLCEKAFASNSKEVLEMIEAANNNNVVLMEAMKITLLPNFIAVKNNINKIGKIRRYFSSYCQYSSRYDKYKDGIVLNAFKPELSNGSLMDIGVYTLAPMVALFGKPNEIKASAYMLESGVDGEGSAIFKYDDMEGMVMYSKISNSYVPTEIQGEEGSIVIDKVNGMTEVKIIYNNGEVEDLTEPQVQENMYYEAEEFINIINKGDKESRINSKDFSIILIGIMDEIRRQIGLEYPADK